MFGVVSSEVVDVADSKVVEVSGVVIFAVADVEVDLEVLKAVVSSSVLVVEKLVFLEVLC